MAFDIIGLFKVIAAIGFIALLVIAAAVIYLGVFAPAGFFL